MKKFRYYLLVGLAIILVTISTTGCSFLLPIIFLSTDSVEDTTYEDDWEWFEDLTTVKPTEIHTVKPTEAETVKPTEAPTIKPTEAPTVKPTEAPTVKPTEAPTTSGNVVYTYPELIKYSNIYTDDVIKVKSILASIVNDSMSDMEKIKAVHDFLVKNTTYVDDYYSRPDSHDQLRNILVNKIGVCQGYAVAFYVFMHELNIPCTLMVGDATKDGETIGHAWNAIKVDGEWYFVDVTWDDPITNGSTNYPDGQNIVYSYALCTLDFISRTHTYDDYVGERPMPYGTSNSYKDWFYKATGADGVYRIANLDTVKEVGKKVNGSCKYVFIIENSEISVNDILNTFFDQINGRIGGRIKYTHNDNELIVTFIPN